MQKIGLKKEESQPSDVDSAEQIEETTIAEQDVDQDKTLWTGLTKWRKGSSFAPVDMPSAELLIENLLVNL